MHIPDGFLDFKTALISGTLAVAGLGIAIRKVRREVPARAVPLIGLAGAFIFAAQMLNFPVAGGTSGHLIGAVLAAVLLGPGAAVLVLSSVLILQCFMFADGGVTALGANLFNMALVAPVVGYGIYRLMVMLMGNHLRGRLCGIAFAAWCSTLAASIACAGQLALSGTVPWRAVFPAMAGVHMLIGIGEALITTLVVAGLARLRPDVLDEPPQSDRPPRYRELAAYGLLISIGLAVFIAPFAGSWPDGLERVAALLGFDHQAFVNPLGSSLFPDYAVPGLKSVMLSTTVVGCAGTLAAFIMAYILARFLTPVQAGRRIPSTRESKP